MKNIYQKLTSLLSRIAIDKYQHSEIGEGISLLMLLLVVWFNPMIAPLCGFVVANCFAAFKEVVFDKYLVKGVADPWDFVASVYGAAKPAIAGYAVILALI